MKRPFPVSKSVKRLKIESEIFSKDINDIKLMFNDDFNEINNERWFCLDMTHRDVAYPKASYAKLEYVYDIDGYDKTAEFNAVSSLNTPRMAAGDSQSQSTAVSDDYLDFLATCKARTCKDAGVTVAPAKLKYDFINPLFLVDDTTPDRKAAPKVVLKSSARGRIDDLNSTNHLDFAEEAGDFVFSKVNLERDLNLIDKLIANAH